MSRNDGGLTGSEEMWMDEAARRSGIRSWNAGFKLIFALLCIVLALCFDHVYVSCSIILGMAYISLVPGRLPFKLYRKSMAIPLGFILTGMPALIFDFTGLPRGEYSFFLGFAWLSTSGAKILSAGALCLRVLAGVSALQMLHLSTRADELIAVMAKMRVPKLILELMYLIYRYIFLLFALYGNMRRAQISRLGDADFSRACRSFASAMTNIFFLSLKRANDTFYAMEARCYEGELRFWEEEKKISPGQLVWAALFILWLCLLGVSVR